MRPRDRFYTYYFEHFNLVLNNLLLLLRIYKTPLDLLITVAYLWHFKPHFYLDCGGGAFLYFYEKELSRNLFTCVKSVENCHSRLLKLSTSAFKRLSGSSSRDIWNCREVLPTAFLKKTIESASRDFFYKLSRSASCHFWKNCREFPPATF